MEKKEKETEIGISGELSANVWMGVIRERVLI
jgi:hypothetical protein